MVLCHDPQETKFAFVKKDQICSNAKEKKDKGVKVRLLMG